MRNNVLLGIDPTGFHKVHYVTFGEPNGQPPVICLHGVTRNGRDFDELAKKLAAAGRHVFCPDLPGRGESEWLSDGRLYAYQQYLADVTALIARTGSAQVDIVGTSMGGSLGILLAGLKNTPIRRLVVNDIGPQIAAESVQRIASYIATVETFPDFATAESYLRKIYAPFGDLTEAQWKHLAEHSLTHRPDNTWIQNYDPAIAQVFINLGNGIDFWPYYDRISCPTLVLRGENSDVFSPEMALEMTQRGPKAKLITIPNVGHAPALRNQEQIKMVADFIL